jgi:hypothetical protein
MSEGIQVLRVVIASPADVAVERDIAATVLEDMNRSVAADRGVRLEAVRWETDTYPGLHVDGPQGLIDPILRIQDSDVLIGIFWRRFGTATMDSSSGTEHEFRLAYDAWRLNGRPHVMVYFNQKPYTAQSKEDTDQWGRVLEFRRTFPSEGLWSAYKGVAQFEKLLRTHLTNFIRSTVPIGHPRGGYEPQFPAQLDKAPPHSGGRTDYFAAQRQIIAENKRGFVERRHAQEEFERFLASEPRGYFIVQGPPGQGKTAFAAQLVRNKALIHHFVSLSGGRSDTRLIIGSLLSQIATSTTVEAGIPETIPELIKLWEELLLAASQHGPTVVVIDGLDELPHGSEAPYLTTGGLPDGVYFVVTVRPGERSESLVGAISGLPHRIYELEPLGFEEMQEVIRSQAPEVKPGDSERIAKASEGNPLYLRAAAQELRFNPHFDPADLPSSTEGFFRRATAHLQKEGDEILRGVLGLLAIARRPLTLGELQQITGTSLRDLDEQGIMPVRHFLQGAADSYCLYHTSFHDFVVRKLLYQDELRGLHRKLGTWLERSESEETDYRWTSLAYHLFESGDRAHLIQSITPAFLADKGRRLGYAVLEDIELVSRALIETRDPASVERAVKLVEELSGVLGDSVIGEATRALRRYRTGLDRSGPLAVVQGIPRISGVDLFVGLLPAGDVTADFVEMVVRDQDLLVAIGDAPSAGLKSAFVGLFIGELFRTFALRSKASELDKILAGINAAIAPFDYFERVSVQLIELDRRAGLLRIANAGHPDPVLYSARRGKCDTLRTPGDLLHDSFRQTRRVSNYEQYSAEVEAGDILVLLSDGLTEAHRLDSEPYGYQFTRILEQNPSLTAAEIGDAIFQDYRRRARNAEYIDDVTIVVIALGRDTGNSTEA